MAASSLISMGQPGLFHSIASKLQYGIAKLRVWHPVLLGYSVLFISLQKSIPWLRFSHSCLDGVWKPVFGKEWHSIVRAEGFLLWLLTEIQIVNQTPLECHQCTVQLVFTTANHFCPTVTVSDVTLLCFLRLRKQPFLHGFYYTYNMHSQIVGHNFAHCNL
jgi:hypothetical protein